MQFGLENTKLKVVLFDSAGVPLYWSLDYMGLIAQNLNSDETYIVTFTLSSSSLETPVNSPDVLE